MGALLYQSPVNNFAAIAEFSKKILNFASNKTLPGSFTSLSITVSIPSSISLAINLTSFIFMNPIIALLPRILIGIVTYYVYTFIKNKIKNKSISIGVASIAGTLTNTIGVLGLTYILYLDRYAAAKQISTDMVAGALLTVIGTKRDAEAIASAVIAIPVVTAISKIRKF